MTGLWFASVASETWHRPSIPSEISTKVPNCAERRTLPFTTSPTRCWRKEGLPDVRLQLLDAEREAAILWLYAENDSANLVTLLQQLGRMLHALGPAQVGDVHETIDAVFGSR